jgi:hypothetical protein
MHARRGADRAATEARAAVGDLMAQWQFTSDCRATSATALADKIAGYAKIRLCESPSAESGYKDWLVHERDRHLIAKALRFYAAHGEQADDLHDG